MIIASFFDIAFLVKIYSNLLSHDQNRNHTTATQKNRVQSTRQPHQVQMRTLKLQRTLPLPRYRVPRTPLPQHPSTHCRQVQRNRMGIQNAGSLEPAQQ